MEAKIQGDVVLSATIRADGSVGDVAVTQSLDTTYGLDDAAVAALQQWTFKPGTKDGRPVDVEVHISMRFTLA
jgi:protein TonB